jgi:hypothetical protein
MITATGGMTSATADMMIAARTEKWRTTCHAMMISTTHVPMSAA